MDIDLLFSNDNQAGLICSHNLVKKAIGVLFDHTTGMMNFEYADMDQLEFNIPIGQELWDYLEFNNTIYIGAVIDGSIAQAYQVPLMFLDDPYRGEKMGAVKQQARPLAAFNAFVTRTVIGQPVHREDLDNDSAAGCILGDASPASLQFAPHLARQHAMEVRPTAAPSAPGFSVPGLGGGSSSGGGTTYYSGGQADGEDE